MSLVVLPITTSDIFAQQTMPEFVTIPDNFRTAKSQTSDTSNTQHNVSNVEINLQALTEPSMNLAVFGKTIGITHEQTIIRNSTDYTYVGSTSDSKNNVFIAVFNDYTRLELSGVGKNYVIEPVDNKHVIRQYSNLAFGSESEGGGDLDLNPNYQNVVSAVPVGEFSGTTHRNMEIDIVFLYTDNARTEKGSINLRLMANLGIDKSNIAFNSSDIPVSLNNVEIAGAGLGYVESDSMVTDLNRLITKNDGYMERGNAVRDNENADIGILLNNHTDAEYCGRASQILADLSNAFSVVNVRCTNPQIGNVIAHELGHLFGMRHERIQDSSTVPFTYGHGYETVSDGRTYTTLMGYPCLFNTCEWRTQWSDPSNNFERTLIVSGTETHVYCTEIISPHF